MKANILTMIVCCIIAAGLCTRHNTLPRDIYNSHLGELKSLMSKGMGKEGLRNNQTYNTGGRWISVKKPKYHEKI